MLRVWIVINIYRLLHIRKIEKDPTKSPTYENDLKKKEQHTTYEEIPALDHDIVSHEGKNATCTTKGHLYHPNKM